MRRREVIVTDMGIFRTAIEVSTLSDHVLRKEFENVVVDTGTEYTWIPAESLADLGVVPVRVDCFETADGRIIERPIGFAMISVAGRTAPSVVVFGLPGEMVLLGAHSLEGLNLRVDLVRRELVPAGPVPVAAAA